MPLTMWTVYDHPLDFPDEFIARKWEVDAGGPRMTSECIASPDIDAIRIALQAKGLVKLMRQDDDDPVIVEVWL